MSEGMKIINNFTNHSQFYNINFIPFSPHSIPRSEHSLACFNIISLHFSGQYLKIFIVMSFSSLSAAKCYIFCLFSSTAVYADAYESGHSCISSPVHLNIRMEAVWSLSRLTTTTSPAPTAKVLKNSLKPNNFLQLL